MSHSIAAPSPPQHHHAQQQQTQQGGPNCVRRIPLPSQMAAFNNHRLHSSGGAPQIDNVNEKNGQRSQLLDEFRNSRIPHLQLGDLGKHVVEFAQDQHGSRYFLV